MSTDRNSSRILVLDGGMGTTIEAQGHDVSSSLWGSEVIVSNPGIVKSVHDGFLKAGADIIETATYQVKPDNLCEHLQCTREESSRILCSAVTLASDMITAAGSRCSLALSFSAYGSTLGQEYAGLYPPPYGPSSLNNAFPAVADGAGRSDEEENAIQALAEHHLEKLRAFASEEETWKSAEWIAFETVPVFHEIRGIRRAMSILNSELRDRYSAEGQDEGEEWWAKKYWIASAYPEGQHPQLKLSGEHAKIQDLLTVLLDDSENSQPTGIGINCTNPAHMAALLAQYTSLLHKYTTKKPWLVFYPDGGQIYNPLTKTWTAAPLNPTNAHDWAESIGSLAVTMANAMRDGEYVWERVIVGGCCKSSFDEIAALRKFVDSNT